MIKQIRLRNDNGWLLHGKHRYAGDSGWDLCLKPIRANFDIPSSAKLIWLTAHKRPGKNRVEVKVRKVQGLRRIYVDGKRYYWFLNTETNIIKLFDKHGTFYVEAEYE